MGPKLNAMEALCHKAPEIDSTRTVYVFSNVINKRSFASATNYCKHILDISGLGAEILGKANAASHDLF